MDSQAGSEMEDYKLHPLLMPSVVGVLVENLHSQDLQRCMLVCKTWNELIKIRKKKCGLLDPQVLASVIKFIPKDSLAPSRLVCALWNDMIIRSERRVKPRRFPSMEDSEKVSFFKFGRRVGDRVAGSSDLQRFQAKFGNPSNLPLPLLFSHFEAPNNMNLSDPSTENFLSTYGLCIKLLRLYRCKWDLTILRKTLFKYTPNLEHLQIICGIIPGTRIGRGKKAIAPKLDAVLHDDPANIPILQHMKSIILEMSFLEQRDQEGTLCKSDLRIYVEQFIVELVRSCPNLEKLWIDVPSWSTRTLILDVLVTNASLCLNNLKWYKSFIYPDLTQVRNLQMKQLKLTSLEIDIWFENVTLEALHALFISLKHTLTSLDLTFSVEQCAHEFPSSKELYKLRFLHLYGYQGQLDFLKDFASLDTLWVWGTGLGGEDLLNQQRFLERLLPRLKLLRVQ